MMWPGALWFRSVTMTAMYAGSGPAGGGVELPGLVLQLTPHCGVDGFAAKPLKAPGSTACLSPALRTFCFHHCEPQKYTEPVAVLSPTTNEPPPGAYA